MSPDEMNPFALETKAEWQAFVKGLVKRYIVEHHDSEQQEAIWAAIDRREGTFTHERQPDGKIIHTVDIPGMKLPLVFETIDPGEPEQIPGYL